VLAGFFAGAEVGCAELDPERQAIAQWHEHERALGDVGLRVGVGHARLTFGELIGERVDVVRVTASRWILRAQSRLRERVLERLNDRLGLSTTDLRSVTYLIRSQLSLRLELV
jgi:hypothetical protein